MKAVKPLDSNMVYKGPRPEILDLHCTRVEPGHIRSQWRLSADEIAWIAAGGDVTLDIYCEPIPPVALNTTEPFCPECMVAMRMVYVAEETLRDSRQVPPGWRFRCPDCGRYA